MPPPPPDGPLEGEPLYVVVPKHLVGEPLYSDKYLTTFRDPTLGRREEVYSGASGMSEWNRQRL